MGKVAIVTGAGRGIGAAVAGRLAADGARTVVNYRKSADEAAAMVKHICDSGGEAHAVQADVSDHADVIRLFDEAQAAFGTVTLLVNNAAARGEQTPADKIDFDEFQQMFTANVGGPLMCMTEFARRVGEHGGRIVNMTSGQARTPMPGASLYAATKGAMESLTRGFAADLGPRGIAVNACAPGATATDTFSEAVPKEIQDATVKNTALGRLGTPEDVAEVVSFLLSGQAEWLTGQIIDADGGLRR